MCEIKVDVNQRFRPANVTPTVQVGAYIRPGKKILNLLWDPWDGTLGTFIITNTNTLLLQTKSWVSLKRLSAIHKRLTSCKYSHAYGAIPRPLLHHGTSDMQDTSASAATPALTPISTPVPPPDGTEIDADLQQIASERKEMRELRRQLAVLQLENKQQQKELSRVDREKKRADRNFFNVTVATPVEAGAGTTPVPPFSSHAVQPPGAGAVFDAKICAWLLRAGQETAETLPKRRPSLDLGHYSAARSHTGEPRSHRRRPRDRDRDRDRDGGRSGEPSSTSSKHRSSNKREGKDKGDGDGDRDKDQKAGTVDVPISLLAEMGAAGVGEQAGQQQQEELASALTRAVLPFSPTPKGEKKRSPATFTATAMTANATARSSASAALAAAEAAFGPDIPSSPQKAEEAAVEKEGSVAAVTPPPAVFPSTAGADADAEEGKAQIAAAGAELTTPSIHLCDAMVATGNAVAEEGDEGSGTNTSTSSGSSVDSAFGDNGTKLSDLPPRRRGSQIVQSRRKYLGDHSRGLQPGEEEHEHDYSIDDSYDNEYSGSEGSWGLSDTDTEPEDFECMNDGMFIQVRRCGHTYVWVHVCIVYVYLIAMHLTPPYTHSHCTATSRAAREPHGYE